MEQCLRSDRLFFGSAFVYAFVRHPIDRSLTATHLVAAGLELRGLSASPRPSPLRPCPRFLSIPCSALSTSPCAAKAKLLGVYGEDFALFGYTRAFDAIDSGVAHHGGWAGPVE